MRAARCAGEATRPSPEDATRDTVAAAVAWLREVEGPARVARLYDLAAPLGETPGPACEEGDVAAALAGVPAPGTAEPLARTLGDAVGVPVHAWVEATGARWLSLGDDRPRSARRIAEGTPIVEDARPRPPGR